MTTSEQFVVAATSRVVGECDVAAVDAYCSATFCLHSGLAAPGIEGQRSDPSSYTL